MLTAYSEGLANEVGPRGVRVNTVAPGFIQTAGADRLVERIARGAGIDRQAALGQIMDSLGGIPLGRRGPPSSSRSSSRAGPRPSPVPNTSSTAAPSPPFRREH
jgi:NAD(P)-dependent dehydrogenase (short-subunit alcohol dehydrogenase family)